MIYKVHWIIDGVAEIDADSKDDAEKKRQETLEEYVKKSDQLMNKFVARSIQGTAYLPGSDDEKSIKENQLDNKKKSKKNESNNSKKGNGSNDSKKED